VSPQGKVEQALANLKAVGGKEEEENEGKGDNEKETHGYLYELIAVGDARNELGQYDKAGSIYHRTYCATIHKSGMINDPKVFTVAHNMLQAWSKSDEGHILKYAYGMAQQTYRYPGCPAYIHQDRTLVMSEKGTKIEIFLV